MKSFATAAVVVPLAPAGSQTFKAVPTAGVENVVRIHVSGKAAEIKASLVSGEFRPITGLPLETGEMNGSYLSRFTPSQEGFRVLIEGKDADGVAFQRIHAPLLAPMR